MKTITLLIIIISGTLNGQNLVENASFELYSSCPNSFEQIDRANYWDRPPNATGTPDYYNACSTGYLDVPNNIHGYQEALDGNAYVAIVGYYVGSGLEYDYREYIQTQLSSPLIAGQLYELSFYVVLADDSRLASNNMGAIFTIEQLNGSGNAQPITVTPQILNNSVVTSTTEWVQIAGTFTASGNEQYLTIGNFFSNNETINEVVNPVFGSPLSYYYIENVSVVPSSLGLQDFGIEKLKVFPNPTNDYVNIATNENQSITEIALYSQYTLVAMLDARLTQFDLSSLPSGIYYLIISSDSGNKTLKKIIKN